MMTMLVKEVTICWRGTREGEAIWYATSVQSYMMHIFKCCLFVGTDDEDHAGDGSDNMLVGDKRGKKGCSHLAPLRRC